MLLILLHELGHYLEATREGLHPQLPVFIPFLGAYVQYTRGNPWQTARVAIAGPIFGGLAALACYVVGQSQGSDLLLALAYFGFFLNLFNLIPVGIFDGGAVWRSARWLRVGGGRDEGDGRLRALLRHRARARRRDDRVPRSAKPRVTSDAKILDEGTSAIEASVAKIAAEFRVGFEKVAQVDRHRRWRCSAARG